MQGEMSSCGQAVSWRSETGIGGGPLPPAFPECVGMLAGSVSLVVFFLALGGRAVPPQRALPQRDVWRIYNGTNTVPGSQSREWPGHVHIVPGCPSATACEVSCSSNTSCTIWTWSPNSHHCYWRLDGVWTPESGGWPGYISGCLQGGARAVCGCGYDPQSSPCPSRFCGEARPAPPALVANQTFEVVATVGVLSAGAFRTADRFRMAGVNMDFWPRSKTAWDGCGALTSHLNDTHLVFLAQQLNGSLLRLGGSPADFLLYDVVPGACSAANLNRTQPSGTHGYFCPIWDQVEGQCLTMERWKVWFMFSGL